MMALEPGFSFIPMSPPDTDWVKEHAVIPDQVSAWPAKIFREAQDADGAMTEMSLDDQVLVVAGKWVVETLGQDAELQQVALLLPVGVARALANMILSLHGGPDPVDGAHV